MTASEFAASEASLVFVSDAQWHPAPQGRIELRTAADDDVTAKDFRTWMGTLLTATGLAAVDRPESDREAKRVITQTIEGVAEQLGNTPAVCRKCYVHPDVIEHFLAGDLRDQ